MLIRFVTPLPAAIAHALDAAPVWAKLGLAAPGERLRERAIERLAWFIADRLDQPVEIEDADQLSLSL